MIPAELFASIAEIINSTITSKQNEFILKLDGEITFNEEYERVNYRQRIIIEKHIPKEVFCKYLRQCIDRIVEKSYEKNKEPGAIGISIFSESSFRNKYLTRSNLNDYILDEVIDELIDELANLLLGLTYFKKNKDAINFYGLPLEITFWLL